MESISVNLKYALADVFEKTIMTRVVGSDGAAAYYPMMARSVDMTSFFLRLTDEFAGPVRQARTSAMLSLHSGQQHGAVIEGGCGPGVSSQLIKQQLDPSAMVLVDSSKEALALARKRMENASIDGKCSFEYRRGNVTELNKLPGIPKADLVFMRSVMRYVRLSDYGRVFDAVGRVLKPGGQLIFDLPLKGEGEWLGEDDAPYEFIAETINHLYDVPALMKTINRAHNQVPSPESVNRLISSSGFDSAYVHDAKPIVELDGIEALTQQAFTDILDGLAFLKRHAVAEMRFKEQTIRRAISDTLRQTIPKTGVLIGTTTFKAVKM